MCDTLLLFVLSLVAGVHLANSGAASFIKKCHLSDLKCTKQSTLEAIPIFTKGIPELGVDAIEPLYFEHLDASSPSLKLLLNQITVTGVKDCIPKKMERDLAKNKLYVKAICTVKLDGQYEMDGRLLLLPIQGKGEIHATLKKVLIEVDADVVEKVGKDGKNHWDVKSWKHTYELQDKAELELKNLFDGSEVLGRAADELFRSGANEVVGEVGPPIIKALIAKVVKSVDVFFNKVPSDELVLASNV